MGPSSVPPVSPQGNSLCQSAGCSKEFKMGPVRDLSLISAYIFLLITWFKLNHVKKMVRLKKKKDDAIGRRLTS